jgi:hypothetical protein
VLVDATASEFSFGSHKKSSHDKRLLKAQGINSSSSFLIPAVRFSYVGKSSDFMGAGVPEKFRATNSR